MKSKLRSTLCVFEHQKISVGDRVGTVEFGEAHFQALVRFADRHQEKYYRLGHRSVRFRSYVGVLQVGNLCIEILPKADHTDEAADHLWQAVLLDMLRACRILKPETLHGAATGVKRHPLLEVLIGHFLTELELLVRQGLVKTYSRVSGQRKTLKGRLCLHQHLTTNHIHQERFYTAHDRYDEQHPFNLLLGHALAVLVHMPMSLRTMARLQNLLPSFPVPDQPAGYSPRLPPLATNRKTERYRAALEMARLITNNFSPDVRSGRFPTLAILFDMNVLFEEYIYRQLAKAVRGPAWIGRQLSLPFWGRSYLRPDLVLHTGARKIVLDTKWKVLKKAKPAGEDVRQMYIYNQFFKAHQGVLLYPRVSELTDVAPVVYSDDHSSCQLIFVPILRDGRLNREVGEELIEKLLHCRFTPTR